MFLKIIEKLELNLPNLEKYFFYLLLFSIPFQTRLILYNFEYRFDEYKSIFLYLTDILIFLIFILWIWRARKNLVADFKSIFKQNFNKILIVFLLIAALSLLSAYNKYLSLYQLIKLLEFALLFFYLQMNPVRNLNRHDLKSFGQKAKPTKGPELSVIDRSSQVSNGVNFKFFDLNKILLFIVGGSFFQSLIALLQFTYQKSLRLKILGETIFDSDTIGIARIHTAFGDLIRAYGTFPHSNIFASFMVLGIFCLFILFFRNSRFWQRFILGIILLFLILGLALSFSRENILTFVVVLLIYFLFLLFSLRGERNIEGVDLNINQQNSKSLITLFLLSLVILVFVGTALFREYQARLDISLQEQALDIRFFYNRASMAIIKDKPILGVGLGNFVVSLKNHEAFLRAAKKMTETFGGGIYVKEANGKIAPWLFQPVHNIYLLIASEIGIAGLLAFLLFLVFLSKEAFKFYKNSNFEQKFLILSFSSILIVFLIVSLSDHYFWTMQQGRLMFWSVLGILIGAINKNTADN